MYNLGDRIGITPAKAFQKACVNRNGGCHRESL
jgi:hypothetical protein